MGPSELAVAGDAPLPGGPSHHPGGMLSVPRVGTSGPFDFWLRGVEVTTSAMTWFAATTFKWTPNPLFHRIPWGSHTHTRMCAHTHTDTHARAHTCTMHAEGPPCREGQAAP